MQTIAIVVLILGVLASLFVVAALMLSSRLSKAEGLVEEYDDWEASEMVQEAIPRQAEQ